MRARILAILFSLLLIVPSITVSAGFHIEKKVTLGLNDHCAEGLPIAKGETVHVKVTASSPVDIYIMPFSEYTNYQIYHKATVTYSEERVTSTEFFWTCHEKIQQSYRLVFDNENGSGTTPTGPVNISYVVGINDAVMVSPDILCWSLAIAGVAIAIATVYFVFIQPRRQKKLEARQGAQNYNAQGSFPDYSGQNLYQQTPPQNTLPIQPYERGPPPPFS